MPEKNTPNLPASSTGKFLKDDGTWDVAGGGASAFTDLTDVPTNYTGDSLKVVRVNVGETGLEFVTLAGGGDMLAANNLSDVASASSSRTNLGLDTTANQTDSANKRFVTDAQLTVIGNTSGTNSGNETASTLGATINGAASATPNNADLVATVDASVVKKITWTNVKAFLKTYFDTVYAPVLGPDDNYVTDAEKVVIGNTGGTNSGDNAVNTLYSGLAASKQDTLVSATNIKTINGASVLGSGDLTVSGGLAQFQVRQLIRR